MDSGFLDSILTRLNDNKNLLKLNMREFEDIRKRPTPNMLPAAKNMLANRIAPDALMVNMRRQKGSMPIRRMDDGRVMYSDASIVEEDQPDNETGRQLGFGNLDLPDFTGEDQTKPIQAKVPEAPTDKLVETLLKPVVTNEGTQEDQEMQDIALPKNAYEAFLQEAGAIPEVLKKELDQYIQIPEGQSVEDQVVQGAEEASIQLQYDPVGAKNLASEREVRYGKSVIPTNAFIRGLPNLNTVNIDDLFEDKIKIKGY